MPEGWSRPVIRVRNEMFDRPTAPPLDAEEKLRRLRAKAEERELRREEQLRTQDSVEALREVYGLSEEEANRLQREVEAEYAAEYQARQKEERQQQERWQNLKTLLFTSRGRLSRSDFWITELGVFVAHSIVMGAAAMEPLLGVFSLICWLAHFNLAIKRCHDRGYSGWFLLLGFVPLLQLWPMLELFFLSGERGRNRFGPNPEEPDLFPF